MTPIRLEVQSLADVKSGKLLFNDFGEALKLRGVSKGQLEGVGALEAGTRDGKVSVTLLVRAFIQENDSHGKPLEPREHFFLVETTAALFLHAGMVVAQAVRKFDPPNTTNKS